MTKQGALEELIKSMFNDAELRSFLGQMPDTAPLLAGLPGGSASLLQVMFETIQLLERHEIIDSEFFAALAAARPRRRQKIQEVAALWGLTLPAASETRAPKSSSSIPPNAASTSAPSPFVPTPKPSAPSPSPLPTDVAILIALEEEWEVFWPIAGEPGGVKDDSGGYLYRFEVPTVAGRPYRCVALFMGAMGPGQATHATARLLAARPMTLVNIGIAAAIHDDLKLCDVVVAEQVDDFLSTVKAAAKGKDGWAFELRGSVYRTTHALVQDLINLKFAYRDAFTRWRSACAPAMAARAGQLGKALEAKHLRDAPAITKVHLASGPVLAAAEAFSKWIRSRDGLLKALEMEAAGMMLAAHQQADPARTLVLRGISDFGDERKAQTDRDSGGAFRHLAMFNATQLLWAMLHQGLLPRHEPSSGGARAGSHSSSTTGAPGDEHRSGNGSSSRRTSPPWDARAALKRALLSEPNAVVQALDERLPGDALQPGESASEAAGRIAAKIDALGEGTDAAKILMNACYLALSAVSKDHPGDRRGAKRVLQAVLAKWLPNRYGSALAPTSRPRPADGDGCEDFELPTPNLVSGEIGIAFAEGRSVAYATKAPVGRARPLVEPRGRIPLLPGAAEMLTYDEMADQIANSIAEQIPASTSSDLERRRKRVSRRLKFLREPGTEHAPKYIALSPEDRRDRLPDAVAERLKKLYQDLGVHFLGTRDDEDEEYILDRILTIFEEDDDRAPGGAR